MLLGISSRGVGLRQVASRLPNAIIVQASAVSKPLGQQRALSFASSTASRSIAFRPCSAVAPSSCLATPVVRPSQLPLIPARFFSEGKELVVNVPFLADSVTSADLQKITKNVGDHVAIDEVIISLETDKVAVEVRAPADGVITEFLAKEGEKLTVGQPLFKLRTGVAPAAKPEAPKPAAPAPSATPSAPAPSAPTPKPEAPKPAAQPAAAAPAAPSSAPSSKPAAAPSSSARVENRVPMKRIRQRIAERLKDAQNTNALLTTFQEADLEKLIELRETFQEAFTKKHGVKLGFMSAFIRASTIALQEQPVINAVIDGTDIVYRDFVDISVAVATPKGLVVPVIRDCQKLSFADIEKTLGDLGDRARKDKIAIEEMAGGTFTISNGGVYGSLMGTPIVNPPQSAILGMHGIFKRPVVRTVNGQDQVVIRPMMYLALTYDHRLIDGREAVTFLRKVKDLIEDPRRILLDL